MSPDDEKLYYKIGEVAKRVKVETHVIRYWETEFAFLKPYKSKGSQRLYSISDIDKLLLIKDYLYDKKFTIEGARKAIKALKKKDVTQRPNELETGIPDYSVIKQIRDELYSIKAILSINNDNKTGG